jgi:hypothetical protein
MCCEGDAAILDHFFGGPTGRGFFFEKSDKMIWKEGWGVVH